MHTTVAVATIVNRCPDARNNFGGSAVVCHHVAVANGHRAAGILSGGHAGGVGAGVGGAFQHLIGRTGENWLKRVAHGDGLHATGGIATVVNRRPGARDHFAAAAVVIRHVQIAERQRAARILGAGYSRGIGPEIGRTFEHDICRTD